MNTLFPKKTLIAEIRVQYVQVANTHKHVMELGGNVPDTYINHELLGMGTSADSANSNDNQAMSGSLSYDSSDAFIRR